MTGRAGSACMHAHDMRACSWVMSLQTATLALSKLDPTLARGMTLARAMACSEVSEPSQAAASPSDVSGLSPQEFGAATVRITSDDGAGSDERVDQQKSALLKTSYMSQVTSKFHFLDDGST